MNWLDQIRNKIIDRKELNQVLDSVKSSNSTIVFTNGCFDILHKGHVEYLSKAADLGDVLVIGLNSDDSVRRQGKGEERPINKIEARSTLLASLAFVDYVVEFDDDTPESLIAEVLPDTLVKGADYDPDETNPDSKKYVVGREAVLQNGGSVKVIDLTPGFSTTGIVNKLKS